MIDLSDLITVIFTANLLTLAFAWGIFRAAKYKSDGDIPLLVYAAIGMPLLYAIITFVTAEPPQFLEALAAPR